VALFSGSRLKPHERFFIPNYHFYQTDHYPGRKYGTAIAVEKDPPQSCRPTTLVSIDATGVCIPIGNSEVLLPRKAWSDANITELLSFRRKSILTGDLNATHPFWNCAVSKNSGEKLMNLFHLNAFEISAPQCPTHYSPVGNGDVLNIVVHQNIRVSNVIVSDILDSDHIPIAFHIVDHVKFGIFWNLLKN
jgi:hypothetical protein